MNLPILKKMILNSCDGRPMEKTNCISLFVLFLASFCNSSDYKYDNYNYDEYYNYNNQKPEDYTDE